jgi:hypothetical protein
VNGPLSPSRLLLLNLVLFVASAGFGFGDCLDPSPTIAAGRDPYAAIVPRDLSPAEHATLKALLLKLDGEWQGTATSRDCRSLNDPGAYRQYVYTAQAEAETDRYGNLYLRKTLYSSERRTTYQENFRLYLTDQRLRINASSAAGDIEWIELGQSRIAFLYRLLLQSKTGPGSTRKEVFITLEAGELAFTLEQRIYSQGRLSTYSMQRFTRR